MKPTRSNPLFSRFSHAGLTSLIVLSGAAPAAEVIKDNNADTLNLTSSWVGGVVPTASDVAVWNSTVTTAGNPLLGADSVWLGLKVANPGGLVTIGAGLNSLSLSTSGIDMSAATQNVVLAPSLLNLTSNQSWNVATGRNLRLAKSAAGAANSDVDGSATITVSGGGVVDANQGTAGGAGFAGFSGKWIVESGTTLRGSGATALAWGTSTAADTITLKGGTLAVGGITGTEGDYVWGQPITLGASTTSKLSAQNAGAAARTLTLTGAVTGTGNLTLEKTQSAGHVFVLNNLGTAAGVRTNVMGTGDITVTGVTLQPRAGGTGNAITHNNNLKLVGGTLISDDSLQTYAGAITLEGANTIQARWGDKPVTLGGNIVDGGVSGSVTFNNNTINVRGSNTYTGGTTITAGTVVVSSGQGLGTGLVTQNGGALTVNPATVGETSVVSSLRTRNDVQLGNNVLFNITSGTLLQRQTNGFWIKASGTGTVGRLTSSSGTLNLSSVDETWVTTTGALGTADHQIQTPIVDFNGSTPLALTKSGVNQVQFTTANTYTGGTTINAGLVRANNAAGYGTGAVTVVAGGQAHLNAGGGVYPNNFTIAGTGPNEATGNFGALRFNNNTIAGSVAIGAGGARIGGTGASGTLTGALTGSSALEINSAAAGANGAVILSGNAAGYTGTATVTQGSLTIGGAFGGSVVKASGTTLTNNGTIASGHSHTTGTLQGTGTFSGDLSLNGTTAADIVNVVPGALHVTGNVSLSGTTTVRASGLGGTVPVLTYGGTLAGNASNLALENAASFRPGTQFNTGTAGIITLDVVGVPVTWTAAVDRNWDVTTQNWTNDGNPDKYFQSDIVTFGDTGAGTVTLVGAIAPRSIAINNSAGNDYTFTGTAGNAISGTTGISKTGEGALTLNSANSFLGAVSLGGGVTTISAVQSYTGGTTIGNGAVLDLTAGGGEAGIIRGTVNVNGGILRLSTADATGWGTGTNRISVMNLGNGGTLEINNASGNETFSNVAITLTGSSIIKGDGAAAYNGNIDLYNGGTSITTLGSATTSIIESGVNLGLRQPSTTITTAAGTTLSGIDLQINGSINNSSVGWANPNLVKDGPGTLCLNNTTTDIGGTAIYSGTTTINAGTLMIGTGGSDGIIGTGAIIDNGTLIFNRSNDLALANAITGTGALVQQGTGTLNLPTGGTRSGDTVIAAGRINIGTAPFTASTFRLNAGGTLGTSVTGTNSAGTVAGLSINGGTAAFRVNAASSDMITVTATNGFSVDAPSSISLTPSGNLQVNDVIPLIDYSGSIGGVGPFGKLSLVASGNPHLSFSLVNNTTDTRVDAKVTAADTLVWKGNVDNIWDEADITSPGVGTSNWQTSSNNSTSKFYDYDKVKFTDAGSAQPVVYLTGEIIPNTVEFDASINYTLEGEGIAGVASLVKNNTGTATLTNFNTYTGPTTVNAGTLEIGDLGNLGATAITNNATFAYNRTDAATFTDSISGTGQLVKRGSGQTTISGVSTFSGPVVVKEGTLVVGNITALGSNASGVTVENNATLNTNGTTIPEGETITLAGTGVPEGDGFAVTSGGGGILSNLVLTANATIGDNTTNTTTLGVGSTPVTLTGAHTLTKAGTSQLWYRAPANGVGNSLAALVVNGGVFGIESNDNGLSGVPVTVNTGGTLSAWGDAGGTIATTQNNPVTLTGGTLGADYAGVTWSGPVTLAADSFLGAETSGQNFTISGVISQTGGPQGLTKREASTVTLTAVNTYTGNTTVNTGTVALADNAGLRFVIGSNGVNNKITGAGTATIDGDFTLDLSGAAVANGNSWTLVDTTVKSFGATFSLVGFTENGDVHTRVAGSQTWTFIESTGVLSLAVSSGGFDSWIANYAALPLDQRAAGSDYDADGLSNLLEYTLGGSPLASDAASITPVGGRSGSNFVVTFRRSDLSEADTTQVLQYGDDLAGWTDIAIGASPGAGMVSISENVPTADLDTVTVTIPTAGSPKFFVHLKVTKP